MHFVVLLQSAVLVLTVKAEVKHAFCRFVAECSAGFYGEGCNGTCSIGCKGGVCNKETGECSPDCNPGWLGEKCNEGILTCLHHHQDKTTA